MSALLLRDTTEAQSVVDMADGYASMVLDALQSSDPKEHQAVLSGAYLMFLGDVVEVARS